MLKIILKILMQMACLQPNMGVPEHGVNNGIPWYTPPVMAIFIGTLVIQTAGFWSNYYYFRSKHRSWAWL